MGMLSLIKSMPKMVAKTTGKLATKVKVNSPQILFWSGLVVTITGFGYAVYSATKVKDAMAESEAKVDEINLRKEEAEKNENNLSDEEKNAIIVVCDKELRQTKIDTAWVMFKLLGIPFMIFAGGLSMSVGGHRLLVKRFGQLSAAFATLQQTFDKYRQLVIRDHGEEADRRYRYGIVDEATTTATITDKNGKEKTVKCKIPAVNPEEAASMYSFIFSEDTTWRCKKDPVMNIAFLRSQEEYWNVWMETRQKPVTLYMVLNDLGIELDSDDPRNDYIMIAGWRPNGDGDNKIDFGIMRAVNKPALDMLDNSVFLNFNCDGNLYHSTRYTKDGKKVC